MNDPIARFLPDFYAKRPGTNSAVRHLVDAFAQQIEEFEQNLITTTLSRYIDFASKDVVTKAVEEDLDKIGSLYNVKRVIERAQQVFEINDEVLEHPEIKKISNGKLDELKNRSFSSERVFLYKLEEILGPDKLAKLKTTLLELAKQKDIAKLLKEHRSGLEDYRRRIKGTIKIFLQGSATASAMINTVVAVFGYNIKDEQVDRIVLPNNHKIFETPEGNFEITNDAYTTTALMARPGRKNYFRLEIIDNPERERSRKIIDQEVKIPWTVEHRGLAGSNPDITLIASLDNEIAYPVLHNTTLGQIIIFNDIVPATEDLQILLPKNSEQNPKAKINEKLQENKLIFIAGGRFDGSSFDQSIFVFQTKNPRFRGLESQASGLDESGFDQFLLPGTNMWEYATLRSKIKINESVEDIINKIQESTALVPKEIKFEWTERSRAAFKVRLPRTISFLANDTERELFLSIINMVKAAGVEAVFEFQKSIFQENHDIIDDEKFSWQFTMGKKFIERHDQQELLFTINGVFDKTRFNKSVFS